MVWDAYLADALRHEYVSWATVDAGDRAAPLAPPGSWTLRRSTGGWRSAGPGSRLAPAHRDQHEAKLLQLCYAFDELGATRVAFKTDQRNECRRPPSRGWAPSTRACSRHQFRMPDGYMRSSVYFSILADEWPAVKERLTGPAGA